MKPHKKAWKFLLVLVVAIALSLPCAGRTRAQGNGGPLTFEGLHRQDNPAASSRAFGGVTLRSDADIGLMFVNPTSIGLLEGLQISIGGVHRSADLDQVQEFAPVRYYPNLSLLLEGLTDRIPDPDPSLIGFTPADSVQRPFDDIKPNWSHSEVSREPLHALLALPFQVGDVTMSVGLGAVRYASLNHYYQNNNVLNPSVLSARPLPILRPTDNNPITADWYQSIRSRDGSMRGYGLSFASRFNKYGLTIGVSGMILDGTSDDFEQQVQRGRLTFLANEFRADSSYGRRTRTGTSEFTGREFTIGTRLDGRYVSAAFAVKPPVEYTRKYEMNVEIDTTGVPAASSVSGEDRLKLPWRGFAGLLLKPHERMEIGIEYELRPYAQAEFSGDTGEQSTPWHSASLLRVGADFELRPWLTLRGGIRGDAEVFVPEGAPLADVPVTYKVYSAGLGLKISSIRWNFAIENARIKYSDIWQSEISKNRESFFTILTDISYTFPF